MNFKGGKITKHCINCGKEFKVYPYRNKTAKFCSTKCHDKYGPDEEIRKKISKALKGKKPYNYKKSRLGSMGRMLVHDKTGRSQYRYRVLVEKLLGRKLDTLEHIHHIDENKLNDLLTNLFITSNSSHKKVHYYSYNYLVETNQIKNYMKWVINKYKLKGRYVSDIVKGGDAKC